MLAVFMPQMPAWHAQNSFRIVKVIFLAWNYAFNRLDLTPPQASSLDTIANILIEQEITACQSF